MTIDNLWKAFEQHSQHSLILQLFLHFHNTTNVSSYEPLLCIYLLSRRVKEIEASKAPQVLTIGDDDEDRDGDEDAASASSEDDDSECSGIGAGDGYDAFSRSTTSAAATEPDMSEGA